MHWLTVVGMTPTWWLNMSITKIWERGGSLHTAFQSHESLYWVDSHNDIRVIYRCKCHTLKMSEHNLQINTRTKNSWCHHIIEKHWEWKKLKQRISCCRSGCTGMLFVVDPTTFTCLTQWINAINGVSRLPFILMTLTCVPGMLTNNINGESWLPVCCEGRWGRYICVTGILLAVKHCLCKFPNTGEKWYQLLKALRLFHHLLTISPPLQQHLAIN